MQQYGTARQATDDDIIRRMLFACWITMATETRSEYITVLLFPRKQCLCQSALFLCFRTLLVVFIIIIKPSAWELFFFFFLFILYIKCE
jgi:hypothetical protein